MSDHEDNITEEVFSEFSTTEVSGTSSSPSNVSSEEKEPDQRNQSQIPSSEFPNLTEQFQHLLTEDPAFKSIQRELDFAIDKALKDAINEEFLQLHDDSESGKESHQSHGASTSEDGASSVGHHGGCNRLDGRAGQYPNVASGTVLHRIGNEELPISSTANRDAERRLKQADDMFSGSPVKTRSRERDRGQNRGTIDNDARELYKSKRENEKSNISLIVIGHVDAGKSTVMGHLLYKMGYVDSKLLHKYEREAKKVGKLTSFYAWILDEIDEERSRGVTIDIGRAHFHTLKNLFTLLDAPGHKDFIPNMILGVTQADVALLMVDASIGEFEAGFKNRGQTKEHILLARSLGISQILVVINKMDAVNFSETRYYEIVAKLRAFIFKLGYTDKTCFFVPCSALSGENLLVPPTNEEFKSWYNGYTVLASFDIFKQPTRCIEKPFRMSIADMYNEPGKGFCVSGRLETGIIKVGETISIQPQGDTAKIQEIYINDIRENEAFAGDNVVINLINCRAENITQGNVLCHTTQIIPVTRKFQAKLILFDLADIITKGYTVMMYTQCCSKEVVITQLISIIDKNTNAIVKERPRVLTKATSAMVEIESSKPLCLEKFDTNKQFSRFVLRDAGLTIAAGYVTAIY